MIEKLSDAIRTSGMFCHLLALTYLFPIPFMLRVYFEGKPTGLGTVAIAAVMTSLWFAPYLAKIAGNKFHPFVEQQIAEIIQYQKATTLTILLPCFMSLFVHFSVVTYFSSVFGASLRSTSVLVVISVIGLAIFFLLFFWASAILSALLLLRHLCLVIHGGMKAHKGISYSYPRW
jgi:uncharacterized Tic20 family protein